MEKIKVLVVFGTRPEAVKMAPIVKQLKGNKEIDCRVCVTAQHRQMLDQVLDIFKITPDYDLNIFKHGQSLTEITSRSIEGLEEVIKEYKPDVLLVQGDTTTVFAGALAGFYHKVKIGHVEAGLRSHDMYSPYPEEANRKLTGVITDFHFAPTEDSRRNLLNEGYPDEKIFITGNTAIDALLQVVSEDYVFENELLNSLDYENKKIILMTAHRRENIGKPMEDIFNAINDVVNKNSDVEVIFPIHLNPKVREIGNRIFGGNQRIHLMEPLDYEAMANMQAKSYLIVTDSGGLQEEAPTLGKPVLVVRRETERPEGIKAGTAKLIGVEYENVYNEIDLLLNNKEEYHSMANAVNPYGDGHAAERIVDIIVKSFKQELKINN
ncbi:UDP-N-acetylglucosamine 2-epimerase (non-hydrolysing) [Proteiniborus ethanoligenes]|uniref:UDP-N-acetylglucosamine 2-epimerase (non-hydrolyzing) n=1 Tax=Proteiniborus ethanoligenes TaxID=415015 RepID=A0A1H3S8D1_9FIRM|nr:UDP-N-acetylglucosamine 2-epimerase (non-hydrolyzing) [Proteiniborus ethanoligenes]SDZ33980.1 UDP-N-acetylglucosamine 2-epimerase (non-hydrolysing) [Proteiniborus ethanoligenes]